MNTPQIFLTSILASLLLCAHIARWYVMPALRKLPLERALQPLVIWSCFRYTGLFFLVPGVVSPNLPPGFTIPAAYGDLLSAALAYLALMALRFRWFLAIPLVWLFNVVGVLDLVNAFLQAMLNRANPAELGAMFFVPTLRVPSVWVSHIMIFALLLRRRP